MVVFGGQEKWNTPDNDLDISDDDNRSSNDGGAAESELLC